MHRSGRTAAPEVVDGFDQRGYLQEYCGLEPTGRGAAIGGAQSAGFSGAEKQQTGHNKIGIQIVKW